MKTNMRSKDKQTKQNREESLIGAKSSTFKAQSTTKEKVGHKFFWKFENVTLDNKPDQMVTVVKVRVNMVIQMLFIEPNYFASAI